jgi:hypothetical protein
VLPTAQRFRSTHHDATSATVHYTGSQDRLSQLLSQRFATGCSVYVHRYRRRDCVDIIIVIGHSLHHIRARSDIVSVIGKRVLV